MAGKNGDLLYFGGPSTDYQCHSETTSNPPHYQFEVQLLGLGPCGFPTVGTSGRFFKIVRIEQIMPLKILHSLTIPKQLTFSKSDL